MKSIKFYIAVLLLVVCSAVNAQEVPYLNVHLADGTYESFKVTPELKASWGQKKEKDGEGTAKAIINDEVEDVPYVQLWAGGPKWATYNVGVTDGNPASYGGHYSWGGSQDGVTTDYNRGTVVLSGTNDTATKLWGSNWRMPTPEEFEELITNCSVTRETVNGKEVAKYTGVGAFSSNYIYLPFSHTDNNNRYGYYWTSAPNEINSNGAYWLYTFTDGLSRNVSAGTDRSALKSVRAVLIDEPVATTGEAVRTGNVNVKWVQLWKGGPKFAEYNVGAANNKAEDYGGYYAWGGSQNNVNDHNTGTTVLSGNNDTAIKLWGTNWRMPKETELQDMLNNCDVTYTSDYNGTGVKGVIVTGRNDYYANSIFLPSAGFDGGTQKGQYGYYWSSTPSADERGYDLRTNSAPIFQNNARERLFSVRPVLKDNSTTTRGTAANKNYTNNSTAEPPKVRWVQLWANGPKFAEFNVGATSISQTGGLYAWGGSQDKVDDHYTGSGNLSGTNDTATKLWGYNWRMPTQAERDALFANCTIGWTDNYNGSGLKGAVLTGKGIYAVNSIFFPCGPGVYEPGTNKTWNGGWGIYWCATSYSSSEGYDYRFNPSSSETSRYRWAKEHCMFVRAVLVE